MPRFNGFAVFSECNTYRYQLGGDIGQVEPLLAPTRVLRPILWIMLNPSDEGADAQRDDATIRTTVVFSEIWGYNRYMVGNLSAFKATTPQAMARARKAGKDIVGPENDTHLRQMIAVVARHEGRIMVAWGVNADPARAAVVLALAHEHVARVYCLKTNKDGSPVHPLYQPHRLEPVVWSGGQA